MSYLSVDENGSEDKGSGVPRWLFTLFLTGIIIIVAGIAVIIVAGSLLSGGSVSSGVVIFIGPFPIAFGAGPGAFWLVLAGVIISAVCILLFVVTRRKIML